METPLQIKFQGMEPLKWCDRKLSTTLLVLRIVSGA